MKRWKIVTTKIRQKYRYNSGEIEFKTLHIFELYKRWFIFWQHFDNCESIEEAEKIIEYEDRERKDKIANKYV